MTISFALADIEERPSTFETPLGPQWIIDDTEDGRPLLVRRLNQARGLLRVAPVLKLASQIDHPRLHGAGHWWRQEDAIYVATPTPRGEPIAVKSPGRRTWHEALDLWQPVAEALRSAHGRGIMHGRINPWNVWYEPTTDRLTIIDLGCWIGDGTDEDLWCAPEMRHDGIPVPPSLPTDVHGLARLLIYLGLGEDEACRERPNFSGLPPYAIPVLERAIAHDPDLRPRRLDELMAGVHFQSPDEALPFDVTDDTSLLFGRVSAREDLSNTKFGRGVRFFLTDSSSAEGEPIGAFFYEGVDRDIYHSIKWVWDGAELNLLGARRVEDSQGRVFLTSHSETLPVLEPHWPISVTNVLKAERCTSRFLVDERDGGSTSRPLVFGNLVHGLLEDLTTPEPPTFEEAIAARLPDLRLAMLAAGLGDADIPTLVAEARQHFENLQEFTARETGDGDERKGWTGGHVEATRYSSVYGLEGRIDLVTEDARDGLQIIELKSGRPWDGHLSQLRSYTLLWEGVAKRRNLPISGYVLYSKNAQMKIVPMEDVRRERRILRARNELIALHRSFVDPGYEYRAPHFMQIPSNCNASACNFRRDRCKEQTGLLGLAPGTVEVWKGFEPALVRRVRAYHA
ncbi:MAG: PD-(D/E)XK nuclease family protein, partial [Bradymonadaceae bacterium]